MYVVGRPLLLNFQPNNEYDANIRINKYRKVIYKDPKIPIMSTKLHSEVCIVCKIESTGVPVHGLKLKGLLSEQTSIMGIMTDPGKWRCQKRGTYTNTYTPNSKQFS